MYAVIDISGRVQTIERDVSNAVRAASALAPNVKIEVTPEVGAAGGGLAGLGAIPAERMPALALRDCGLPVLSMREVMRGSMEEAFAVLKPFFPTDRTRVDGTKVLVHAYDSPMTMRRHILGQNYKTSKDSPDTERPTSVQGLSLLPFSLGKQMSAMSRALPMRGLGLCVGSSAACRASCLVYSGHNLIDIYNVRVKTSRTEALSLQPRAFYRMLVENVRFYEERGKRLGWEPFVRLNVFSDVPWELLFPDLFAEFPRLQFYDYTKVPGRTLPQNYDLTFSWSGVNRPFVDAEIRRGKRIAVVFLLPGTLVTRREQPFPKTFLGLPVVDGDVSDLRPFDPAPSIVGLRWKIPHKQNIDLERKEQRAFVVPCEEIDGQLVASQSARQEPIKDPDSDDPDVD